MEIRKDVFRWFFTTTLPDGQKFVLKIDKSLIPKYTRKPKGITREVLIQLAARVMRERKRIGVMDLLSNLKVGMLYIIDPGEIDIHIFREEN